MLAVAIVLGLANVGSSPGWQLALVSVAAAVILLEMSRGWRLGLARQVVRLIAFIAAYGCAYFAGWALLPFVRPLIRLPDPILAVVAGSFLAALVYAAGSGLGTILFKRTAEQPTRLLRLFYGFSGAALGILFGAFFIWLTFSGIRFLGAIAQAQTAAPDEERPAKTRSALPDRAIVSTVTTNPLVSTLAQIKTSLEAGPIGANLTKVDPIPADTYNTFAKLGEVSGRPRAAERFLDFPGVREIGEDPKVVALRNDPAVANLVARHDFLGLLQNDRVIAALNDPGLVEKLKHFDLNAALDQALQQH